MRVSEWPSGCADVGAFVVVDVVVDCVQLLSSLPSVQSFSPSHCQDLRAKKIM